MKSLIDKLWDFYLSEQPMETDPDKIAEVGRIAETLDALLAVLNDEQRRLLCTYNDLQSDYHAQAERDAFIGGIHFAAAFFADAMRGTSL